MKKIVLDERMVNNFKRLSNVIIEQNLFGNKEIQTLTKKFNDSSEEVISKIQLFALYRNTQPFNTVKSVMDLKSIDQLNELIDIWKERTIQTIQKNTSQFIEGEELVFLTEVLNWFIKNANKFDKPFSVGSIEQLDNTLFDIYTEHTKKKVEINKDDKSLYNPNEDDIVFEDNNIVIVSGSTMGKCVIYGKGNTWCISRSDSSNMFQSYRYKDLATIYFVLFKNKKNNDDEKEIVILNYPNSGYSIADKTNKGKRSGGKEHSITWGEVERTFLDLTGKEQYFVASPPTEDEIKYSKIVKEHSNASDFYKFIIDNVKNLYINGSKITPQTFIRDYMSNKTIITNPQFDSLWERRNNKLVEEILLEYLKTGKAISEYQFKRISEDE